MEFRPSLVSWNLTKRCNLRCPHCYLSAGKKAEDGAHHPRVPGA